MPDVLESFLERVIFMDIETGYVHSFEALDDRLKHIWRTRAISSSDKVTDETEKDRLASEKYYQRASLMPAYSKVITIILMRVKRSETYDRMYEISGEVLSGHNEKKILSAFYTDYLKFIQNSWSKGQPAPFICGHNIRGFDLPFILQRILLNGLVPEMIKQTEQVVTLSQQTAPQGKPFLIERGIWSGINPYRWLQYADNIIDTLEVWRGFKSQGGAKLEEMAFAMSLPNPKENTTGDQIPHLYLQMASINDLHAKASIWKDIIDYCVADTLTVVSILAKMFCGISITTQDSRKKISDKVYHQIIALENDDFLCFTFTLPVKIVTAA